MANWTKVAANGAKTMASGERINITISNHRYLLDHRPATATPHHIIRPPMLESMVMAIGKGNRNRRDANIVIANVADFVSDDSLQFLTVHHS